MNSSKIFRIAFLVTRVAPILFATGCSRVPTFDILGSFFPAWIVCGVMGVLLTVGVRILFVRVKFEQELSSVALIYPCLAALFTFSAWFLFFS